MCIPDDLPAIEQSSHDRRITDRSLRCLRAYFRGLADYALESVRADGRRCIHDVTRPRCDSRSHDDEARDPIDIGELTTRDARIRAHG